MIIRFCISRRTACSPSSLSPSALQFEFLG